MRLLAVTLTMLMVAAACGSDDKSSDSQGATSPSITESSAPPTGPTTGAAGSLFDEPTLNAGGSILGDVTIDGTVLQYISVVPEGFRSGDIAPVLLALPPGGQDVALTTGVVRGVYQNEAVARGWVVISPAAPGGELFFKGSERLIPAFLDFVESWVTPENGAIHLSGISNGGISAFRVATQNPDRFGSLTVFPGFPTSEADRNGLDALTGIPVHLFVGERDVDWIERMEQTFDRLDELGGQVTFEVFPDEGHVIGALSNGVRIFDELDAAR